MMRTLYVRIIMMTMIIMIASAVFAFVFSNVYYQNFLKSENDEKVTKIAKNIVTVFVDNGYQSLSSYLLSMTDLGYMFYVVDENGDEQIYGDPFRLYNLEQESIDAVLNGQIHHGIAEFPWSPFVTGFFDNELKNTVGIPIEVDGKVQALFIRPNTSKQFGEMRVFLAVLLVFSLLFSFVLVLISTRYIVNPIKGLTEATRKIAAGNYHVKLNVKRRDEIGRLADDFSRMSDRLEQTEEKRQEFVSNVSHEIQSPLTSIQGFSQAMREQEFSEEERMHYLSIIEKESRRLSLLSKQLLTLSFLDGEIDQDQKVSFDVADQLKEVVSSLEWQWSDKEIAIEIDVAQMIYFGDPRLLHQVWMNLLTNAIKYNTPGGTIMIQGTTNKTGIDVILKDTGVGIDKQDLSQLFDRFYKVDKARTRIKTGTGLGLSIAKKVIELHNGTIMVESELGKGSEFHVFLPGK